MAQLTCTENFEELCEESSGPMIFMFNMSWNSREIINVMENVENAIDQSSFT